jgi:hypothetical protein
METRGSGAALGSSDARDEFGTIMRNLPSHFRPARPTHGQLRDRPFFRQPISTPLPGMAAANPGQERNETKIHAPPGEWPITGMGMSGSGPELQGRVALYYWSAHPTGMHETQNPLRGVQTLLSRCIRNEDSIQDDDEPSQKDASGPNRMLICSPKRPCLPCPCRMSSFSFQRSVASADAMCVLFGSP